MRSLQSRLGSGLLLSLILAFSGLWLLVSLNIQFLTERYVSSRLEHDAESLLRAININDSAEITIDEGYVDPVYSQPFSGHYYQISTGAAQFGSRSLWDQTLQQTPVATGDQRLNRQTGPERQTLLVFSAGYVKQGQPLTLSIAENLDPVQQNIRQFSYSFTATAVGILILLVLVQSLILRRSLRPLDNIQYEIKLLEQGKLDSLSSDVPAELHPLINEVNHLLSVMEQRLRRSRNALGDLAHALKKPLTVIQQLTDNLDIPKLDRSRLVQQTDDIYRLSDRILTRARLAGPDHRGTRFSFSADLPDLLNTLNMLHRDKTVAITTDISENIYCPIDREDMLELLGNVLDNAYKWAEAKVHIRVRADPDLQLVIEDDGPGADPDEIEGLTLRGVRMDETTQGHGFGLAITADIVSDYKGVIRFTQAGINGGLRVEISLPLNQG